MNLQSKNLKWRQNTSSDHELIFSGWFENHPTLKGPLPQLQEIDSFVGSLWPMSPAYTNPLNAIWSMQVVDLRLLASRRYWFLRDGLVPLLWFFKRYPKAPPFETRLLIDEAFADFVPEGWRERVGTYRLHSEVGPQPNSRTALIGLAAESYASLSFAQKQLPKILARETAEGSASVDLFMPVRSTWAHDEREQAFHAKFFREVFKALPEATRIMTRGELVGTFDVNKLRVCDLNEKLMVADNSLVNDLLAKGAQWPQSRPIVEGEDYRRLSPFHGFALNWNLEGSADHDLKRSLRSVSRYHEEIENVFSHTPVFQAFPWPRWFAEWARSEAEMHGESEISGAKTRLKATSRPKKKVAKKKVISRARKRN